MDIAAAAAASDADVFVCIHLQFFSAFRSEQVNCSFWQ